VPVAWNASKVTPFFQDKSHKEKASNAFFGTNVNKSVYLFVYGFRLTFVVFMDGDLPNSFSAASFIGEQTDRTE
jgi:hypothetical protein